MANWCSTTITFYTEGDVYLSELNKLHKAFMDKYENDNSTNSSWIGFIGEYFGIPGIKQPYDNFDNLPEEVGNIRGFYIKGDNKISYMNIDNTNIYYFEVSFEDAWDPKIGIWEYILTNCLQGVNMAFIFEEPGMGYYGKHDPTGLFYNYEYIFNFNTSCYYGLNNFKQYKFVKQTHPNSIFLECDDKVLSESDIYITRYRDNTISFSSYDNRFETEEQLINYYNKFGNANFLSEIEGDENCSIYQYDDYYSMF